MASTVVGLFDDREEARDVVRELNDAGIDRNEIGIVTRRYDADATGVTDDDTVDTVDYDTAEEDEDSDVGADAAAGAGIGAVLGGVGGLLVGMAGVAIPGIGAAVVAGPIALALAGAGVGAAAGGLIGALTNLGVPEEHAHYYAEGVRRGSTLVTVRCEDDEVDKVTDIMHDHGAVDINRRAAYWQKAGWKRFDHQAKPYTPNQVQEEHKSYGTKDYEAVVPVAEEKLKVGKRPVPKGGVRVFSHVENRPVKKDVTLRDEEVEVERRSANRPVRQGDKVFKEGSVTVTETDEEPVVEKDARVTGEVVVKKDVGKKKETVRGNVRKQDVDVKKVD